MFFISSRPAGHVDLAQIAGSIVLPCLMQPNCNRILMRRCCLFLGESSVLLTRLDMTLYFRALFHALSQADAAVALASCSALTQTMQSLDCVAGKGNMPAFLPVLPGVIEQLVKLLHALEEEDSKTKILHAISVTISHAGESATQLASGLIATFPQLWSATRNCSTTQPKCLMLATSLINCARVGVTPHVPALCSAIAFTVNASDPSTLTTREYSLDVWLAIMRNVTAYTEELHKLFEYLIPLMHEDHCDNIKTVTLIVDSYVLLGGATFASVYSTAVLQGFARLLRHTKEPATLLVSQSVHVLFVAVPGVVGTDAAGAMCAAVAALASESEKSPHSLVLTSYYGVLARYCFVNTQNFIALCQHLGENALDVLMEVSAPRFILLAWHLSHFSHHSPHKLQSMFTSMDQAPPQISCLMLSCSLQVLVSLAAAGTAPARLHALAHGAFNAAVNANSMFTGQRSVQNHLYALSDNHMKQMGMYVSDQDSDPEAYVLPEFQRKRALAAGDPIAALTPKSVLVQSTHGMQTSMSPEVMQAILAGVDPDILKQAVAITQQP